MQWGTVDRGQRGTEPLRRSSIGSKGVCERRHRTVKCLLLLALVPWLFRQWFYSDASKLGSATLHRRWVQQHEQAVERDLKPSLASLNRTAPNRLAQAAPIPEPEPPLEELNAPLLRPQYYVCEWHANAPEPCLPFLSECPSSLRDEAACAALCDKTSRCRAYVFNKYRNCYLRARRGHDTFPDDPKHETRLCVLDAVLRNSTWARGPSAAESRRRRHEAREKARLETVPRPRRQKLVSALARLKRIPSVELVLARYEENVTVWPCSPSLTALCSIAHSQYAHRGTLIPNLCASVAT